MFAKTLLLACLALLALVAVHAKDDIEAVQRHPDPLLDKCPNQCSGKGVCLLELGECRCFAGYGAKDCSRTCPRGQDTCGEEALTSGCKNDCNGRGRCLNDHCECFDGFKGEECEIVTCPRDCSYHGVCHDGVCTCDNGYEGEDCSRELCPNGCSQNGRCVTGECKCYDGWSGFDCSLRMGAALHFDGVKSMVQADFDYPTGYVHADFWIKPEAVPSGYIFGLSSPNEKGTRDLAAAAMVSENGKLLFRVKATQPSATWLGLESETVFTVNNWYHVYLDWTSGDAYEIWVNGRRDKTYGTMINSEMPKNQVAGKKALLTLGTSLEDGRIAPAFKGSIAEFRTWDRRLTEEQVQMYAHKRAAATAFGLSGYWPMDEAKGTVVHDVARYRRDGTCSATSWDKEGPLLGMA